MAPAEARDIEDPVSAEVMAGGDLLRDPAATIADLMALVKIIEHQWGTAARRMTGTGSQRASMRTDSEIRADVIRELQWDPQVTGANAIGVAVQDGAVVLTANVGSYAEKVAAMKAATRVYGVTAVADEIRVHLSGESRDDADIAQDIAHILEPNTQVPAGKVHARVRRGWVTLDGQADYEYQRREVERMVRHVRGVIGITNNITVTPAARPDTVQAEIEEAFGREAEVDARQVRVEVHDHTATLYGHVHSLHEATAAAAAAAAAPGVATVESHLLVST